MSLRQSSRFDLPGFTLPLNYRPEAAFHHRRILFPNALDYGDIEYGSVHRLDVYREILMMRVMNTVTDKPEWATKVFEEDIISKWRKEILQSGQDVTPKMLDWVIQELQWKASILQKEDLVSVFDVGVVKSDTIISEELQQALKLAAAPFEHVQEEEKDYHPGSDHKVVDLVHPSLFPVIYGRTRILHGRVIDLHDCLASMGQGEVIPVPSDEEAKIEGYDLHFYEPKRESAAKLRPFSRKFQWLPCDVEFTDGDDTGCRIVSYINNAHPVEHRALYEAVERIIARAIPLWNKTLTGKSCRRGGRIAYSEVEYLPIEDADDEDADDEDADDEDADDEDADEDTDVEDADDGDAGEDNSDYEDYDSEESWERHDASEGPRPIKLPEPGEFETPSIDADDQVNLRERFCANGLQVIVKLANIELTPERPEYGGGTWHVEGQLNERICATAIYYYDNENITQSTLAFRQRADAECLADIRYPQDRHEFLHEVFGFGPDVDSIQDNTQITQDLGSVVCQEGRLLTFPNILQHRVSPFSLADRSRPGHRKILALFLIDPNMRIISSANVPPQRQDWGQEKRLPQESLGKVTGDVLASSLTLDEAKRYRLELMEERSAQTEEQNEKFESGSFSLCEH